MTPTLRLIPLALASSLLIFGCQKTEPEDETATPKESAKSSPTAQAPITGPKGSFVAASSVLTPSCSKCHGETPKEGVDVRTYESIMKGGQAGPLVKAGDPKGSLLVQVLRGANGHKVMPPRNPLSEEQIKAVEDWISAGAKS